MSGITYFDEQMKGYMIRAFLSSFFFFFILFRITGYRQKNTIRTEHIYCVIPRLNEGQD